MESKLISIIVPVYNVEHFVDHCIQSIVDQTYGHFELILIDDGSKDTSGEICDEWAKKDERIRVIHQQNGGLSAARNAGLDGAKGDYICFVDSDDFVTENYLEDLYEAAEATDADIAISDINSAKLCESDNPISKTTVLTPQDCREWLTNPISREYVLMVISCCKLYKKKLFDDIRFEVGRLHEDEFIINHFLYLINKAVFIPHRNYIYRNNDDGITGKENVHNIDHLHTVDAYENRMQIALENGDRKFASITFKWALLKLVSFYNYGDDQMKSQAKIKYDSFYEAYKELLTTKQRLKYRVFKEMPAVFCKVFIR